MFPNWSHWKTVKGLLFAAVGFTGMVPQSYQQLYTVILGAVGSVVVVLSGTSIGPTVSK